MVHNKPNRKRNKAVTFRMTDAEYQHLLDRVEDSGLSQQSFIINAIIGATIISSDEVAVQKEISKTFSDLVQQLRGLSTNVNQMAHMANAIGALPQEKELIKTSAEISDYRKECEDIWLSIRSLINQPNHTEQ